MSAGSEGIRIRSIRRRLERSSCGRGRARGCWRVGGSDGWWTGEAWDSADPHPVGTGAGPTAVADLVIRWRKAHLWQEIIDARGDKMRVSKDSSIKDGRIIVVSADDQKVEIHDVSGGIDVTRVREAALKSGADAVEAAADAAGRKGSSPHPAAPEPAGGS
jgi:hypothetical protein